MSPTPDALAMMRAALAASTQTENPEVAVFYVASARLAFTKATEELRQIERVLVARERELARRGAPKQLAMKAEPE